MSKKKANAPVAGVPGSDPTIFSVPVNIGGRIRHLAFDWAALSRAEKITGLNIFGHIDFHSISAEIFQGLLFVAAIPDADANEEKLTFEQVGKWIKPTNAQVLLWAVASAFNESKPETEDLEEANPQQAE